MNRILYVGLAAAALTGCRSTQCQKRACVACPPPAPILAPAPAGTTAPEIIFPSAPPTASPLPPAPLTPSPSVAPPPPAPNFPAEPRSSGFAPPPAGGIADIPSTSPKVILDKPEFTETSRVNVVSLKGTTVESTTVPLSEVVSGRVATGRRPTLDDLDRLNAAGYRRLICLDAGAFATPAEQRVLESRQFRLVSAAGTSVDPVADACYVYSDDPKVLRAWWRRYFRDVEHLSDDAARIRADRLVK